MIFNTKLTENLDGTATFAILGASQHHCCVPMERDEEGGGWVSARAYERWLVQDWVRYARAVGIAADDAPDSDAPQVAWLYVGGVK